MKPPPEWSIVGLLTILAAALRFWGFGRLGLTHFDEGVYAIAGFWSVLPGGLSGLDPQVIAYAPPGFPILVGLSYAVFGVADSSALFVAIVCGILTVPAVAWVGRRTFGLGAGAASAAFAALAMAHVAFSRKALTDAPFLLLWVLALGLGGRFLERPGLLRAIGFGLAVGAAQNFKYNGWIAGAIVVLAALVGLVRTENRKHSSILRTFGFGLIAVVVAAGCYVPWFQFVERHGGYAALMRHHQSYLGGVGSWPRFWEQQLAQVWALSGGIAWGALTWAVAWTVATIAARSRGSWRGWFCWAFGLIVGAVALGFEPDLGWWAGVGLFVPLLRDERPGHRVLGAWWLVMSLMTPFYHPYARLWMPLHAAGWILLAGVVKYATAAALAWPEPSKLERRPDLIKVGIALAILAVAGGHWGSRRPMPLSLREFFEPTDDLKTCVAQVPKPPPFLASDGYSGEIEHLRVLGRRPLAFYLAVQGKVAYRLVPDSEALGQGPSRPDEYALIDEAQFADVKNPWWVSFVGPGLWHPTNFGWPTRLDPVTLLDIKPGVAFNDNESRTAEIMVYFAAPGRRASSRNVRAE